MDRDPLSEDHRCCHHQSLPKAFTLFPFFSAILPSSSKGPVWLVTEAATSGTIGLFSFAIMSEGFFFRPAGYLVRILFGIVTALMFCPGYETNAASFWPFYRNAGPGNSTLHKRPPLKISSGLPLKS